MSTSVMMACAWLVLANVVGLFPSKRKHWPQAYILIAIGVPILAFVFWQSGILSGTLVFLAAASILRWPVRYFIRWLSTLWNRPASRAGETG